MYLIDSEVCSDEKTNKIFEALFRIYVFRVQQSVFSIQRLKDQMPRKKHNFDNIKGYLFILCTRIYALFNGLFSACHVKTLFCS